MFAIRHNETGLFYWHPYAGYPSDGGRPDSYTADPRLTFASADEAEEHIRHRLSLAALPARRCGDMWGGELTGPTAAETAANAAMLRESTAVLV